MLESPTEQLRSYCGSPHYAAPELFGQASYEGPPVDLWAIGVMLHMSLLGSLPFESSDIDSLIEKVTVGCFILPTASNKLSHACTDMLYGLIEREAPLRWNAVQFKNCSWFENAPPLNNRLSLLEATPTPQHNHTTALSALGQPPGGGTTPTLPTSLPRHHQQMQSPVSVVTLSSSTPSSPRTSRLSRASANSIRCRQRHPSLSLSKGTSSTCSSRVSTFSLSASSPSLGLQRRRSSQRRARGTPPRLSTRIILENAGHAAAPTTITATAAAATAATAATATSATLAAPVNGRAGGDCESSLRATSAGNNGSELRRSLREMTKEKLVALGMPPEKCHSESLMNPRQSLTGSFRIMLHRAEVNEFEKSGVDFPTSWIRPNKGLEKTRSSCSAPQPLQRRNRTLSGGRREVGSGEVGDGGGINNHGRSRGQRRVGAVGAEGGNGAKRKSRLSVFCSVM